MDDLVDDTRKKVGAPHMKTGIWFADVENSFDETATSSKLLCNSKGRNM